MVIGLVFVGSRGGSVGPALASLAVAAYAAGSVVGTLIAGWHRPRSPSLTVARFLGILSLGALLVAIGPDVGVPVGALLFGLGEGYFLVIFLALRAETTPPAAYWPRRQAWSRWSGWVWPSNGSAVLGRSVF